MDKSEGGLRRRILDYFSLVHKVSLFLFNSSSHFEEKQAVLLFYCINTLFIFNLQIYIENLKNDAIVQVKIDNNAQPDY